MIQSIKVINYLGESLIIDLRSPEKSGFFISNIEGLGPTKSTVNMTEVLSTDGAFFNSSRSGSRNLVFTIGFMMLPNMSIEAIRQQCYRFFPNKRPVDIEITTDRRVGRTIGYVESNDPDIFSKDEETVISIICPNAYFYEKSPTITGFVDSIPEFQFPFSNESLTLKLLEFSQVVVHTEKNIFYNGDAETGVVITIDVLGAVHNLSIFNTTSGERMDIDSVQVIALTGGDLQSADQIIISTLKGAKTIFLIRGGVVYNIFNAIGQYADWFVVTQGNNVFTYSADTGTDKLMFSIENNILYEGL